MHVGYLLFFLSLGTYAQPIKQIQVLPNPKSIDDFEHEFKGCPENSECDQVMGHEMQRWHEFVKNLKNSEAGPTKKTQTLEIFREKYGIPTDFYTNQMSKKSFGPILYNSACRAHNPKDQNKKILRGTAFVKNIFEKKAQIWKDQTLVEIEHNNLFTPKPVTVFYPEGPKVYHLSLDDQPLLIKNKEIYILKEEDDLFYGLKISVSGEWKIVDLDFSSLSDWQSKQEIVECSKDKQSSQGIFENSFCKKIWDETTKKALVVKISQGCII